MSLEDILLRQNFLIFFFWQHLFTREIFYVALDMEVP